MNYRKVNNKYAEIGTNFADILINYISLNDYDKKIALI